MDEIEAFRILLGPLLGERPDDLIASRSKRIRQTVANLLSPLKLGKRLAFFRAIAPGEIPAEWLVVKIRPSGQLPLWEPQALLAQLAFDVEGMRETQAALELARRAVVVLRELATTARLTPVEFHNILFQPDEAQAEGLALGAVVRPMGQLMLREPNGVDLVAPVVDVISRTTMIDLVTIRYLPVLVGELEAQVRLQRAGGGYFKKRTPLHWGAIPLKQRISTALFSAARKRRQLSAVVRETCNSKGLVVRLEWVDSLPRD
jgi:hypothetical protein